MGTHKLLSEQAYKRLWHGMIEVNEGKVTQTKIVAKSRHIDGYTKLWTKESTWKSHGTSR